MAKKPDFRAVVNLNDKFWREIGGAWMNDKGNFSVTLQMAPIPKDGKMSFVLVPNEDPKPESESD